MNVARPSIANWWVPELKLRSLARLADRSGISGNATVAVPFGTCTLLSCANRPIGRLSSARRSSTRVAETTKSLGLRRSS
ncbi:MAG TPA: hypothetical protein VFN08_19575, partial [Gemmatimonadales bacterium]|nr:hypothetical protein [Gemmatimonadales bacterium]